MTPDQKWLRERLEELEKIDRPSASEGERTAPTGSSRSAGSNFANPDCEVGFRRYSIRARAYS
jgi:hypothetical protein